MVSHAFAKALTCLGIDISGSEFFVAEDLPDGTELYEPNATLKDLEIICNLEKRVSFAKFSHSFPISFRLGADNTLLALTIEVEEASTLDKLRKTFENTLLLEVATEEELDEYEEDKDEKWLSIVQRLDSLESIILAPTRRLRCFLSYRFSESNEVPALRIKQFLTLLNVEVISGVNYEPRKVSEKVLSRLHQPLDFIVLLLTDEGESMWTRDEIATALHKNIALIPIVEKGVRLTPGLLADIEYVEYIKGHVGDAFLKLLEAVCFIREQKESRPNRSEFQNKTDQPK